MSSETLFDMACFNYRLALKDYQYMMGDERELNHIGYLLQQSIELAIKHCLEIGGIRYPHSHIIEDLLDECEKCNVRVKFSDELYMFAPAISKWESLSRYVKDYFLSKRQIETGFRLIRQFLLDNGAREQDLTFSLHYDRGAEPERDSFTDRIEPFDLD